LKKYYQMSIKIITETHSLIVLEIEPEQVLTVQYQCLYNLTDMFSHFGQRF